MTNEHYIMIQTRGTVFNVPFFSENGKGVLKFKILTKNHDDQAVHADVIAFGSAASEINSAIGKGDTVHIRSSFKTGSYENRENQRIGTHEIFIKSSDDLKVELKAESKIVDDAHFGKSQQLDIKEDDLPF